jgi:hypothetical protein
MLQLKYKTMFIKGVARVDKIITLEDRNKIKDIMLNNNLNKEDDLVNYKNSVGRNSIPELEAYFQKLTPIVEQVVGMKLKPENTYARIYNNESTLTKHLDRDGLDITLSIQIDNTTGYEQSLYLEGYDGTVYSSNLKDTDALIIRGRDLQHWRNPIKSVDGGKLFCLFLHWRIVKGELLEIENLISPSLCNLIIQNSEELGFEKSKVYKGDTKEGVHDDNSRSSSTQWFQDKYYIGELIRNNIPEIKNLKFEGWQLVKYTEGEEFKPHLDALSRSNDRLFTVIIYLNDNYEGGTTSFPNKGEVIKPKQGKLTIWKNLIGNKPNQLSLHAGDKVTKGTKYVLVNWILNKV